MSHASISHFMVKPFLDQLTKKTGNEISTMMMNKLKEELRKTSNIQAQYIKEIINQGNFKFFIVPSLNPSEPSIGLVSKNLKSIMFLALNTTDKKFLKYYNSPFILDLLHIHSFQKGEGRKLMEAFLQIHRNLNIPGSLWTETSENVSYFEKYGFECLGKLGANSDYLMKLPAQGLR